MDKHLIAISDILKSSMGLDYNSIGISSIEAGVKNRLDETGMPGYQSYLSLLSESEEELKALIEKIVIPETWFFRDEKPYAILSEYLRSTRQSQNNEEINILSLPSSTGEEPYSIAMTLANLGWDNNHFNIDAYDISIESIKKAREGIYTQNSFRIPDTSYIDRYFTKDADLFYLNDEIKDLVNFHQGNMFDNTAFPYINKYDVIFCRNLIIYFDSDTQTEAFSVLARLLKKDGIMILGHAETAKASNGKFLIDSEAGAYLFRKATSVSNKKATKPIRKPQAVAKATRVKKANAVRKTVKTTPVQRPPADLDVPTEESKSEPSHLNRISELANTGEIKQGIELCHAYLKDNEKDAEGNYLMAVLHDANGDAEESEKYLRKTIYLDPDHVEAIIHMALIADKNGDTKTAERMRTRAKRAEVRRVVKMDKLA